MKTLKISHLLFIVLALFFICSCGDGSNEDPFDPGDPTKNFAPESLPIGCVLAKNDASNHYPLYYWVKGSNTGWHYTSMDTRSNTPLFNPYTYTKTGNNTADFSFTVTQYINGPVSVRMFRFQGTLTFQATDKCKFEGVSIYNGNSTKESVNLVMKWETDYPALGNM